MSVGIAITDGPSANVAWTAGMSVKQVLEEAESYLGESFIFSLEYYGPTLGYLVNMINETYDTFKSSGSPFYYWELLVNGVPSSTGVDSTFVEDGDTVTFTFVNYSLTDASSQTHAKQKRRSF